MRSLRPTNQFPYPDRPFNRHSAPARPTWALPT